MHKIIEWYDLVRTAFSWIIRLVIQVKIVFSVINNFNEGLIFVANKDLHIFPRNISDSYHVFKLIIIRTKNVHHNVLELIIRYKILSCVIWKLLLWIKKRHFPVALFLRTSISATTIAGYDVSVSFQPVSVRYLSNQFNVHTNNNKYFLLDINLIL